MSAEDVLVLDPGMLTTVQDCGRWGFQSSGVPVAGPMDPRSHWLANALVGNDRAAATVEVTLAGPQLQFGDDRLVAVAGAAFQLTVGGRRVPSHEAFVVPAGSDLRFGSRVGGARAYLAIEGGVAVAPVLGSRATHVGTAIGGFDGRSLRVGDRLPLGERVRPRPSSARPRPVWPAAAPFNGAVSVRVLPGPHADFFADGALETLQAQPYSIGGHSDRMGFRLDGRPIARGHRGEMISGAMPLGALQVPASGLPILLMADRPTTGGYPVLATVITADIGFAGQLAPGDRIRFVVCSAQEALTALLAEERTMMAFECASPA